MDSPETRISSHPRIEIAQKLSRFVTHDPFLTVGIRLLSDRNADEVNKKYISAIMEASSVVKACQPGSQKREEAVIKFRIKSMQHSHALLLCGMLGNLDLKVKARARDIIGMDPKEGFIKMEEILLELDEARKNNHAK